MENIPAAFRSFCILFASACFAGTAFGDVLFSDNFDDKPAASRIAGSRTAEGFAYLARAEAAQADLRYENNAAYSGSGRINMYVVREHSASIVIDKDLDRVEAFDLNLGYVHFAARGSLIVNAAASSETRNGGYRFTFSEFFAGEGETIRITHIDAKGAASVLGYVSDKTLRNIRISVSGNTQRLYVDGVPYGSAVPTQRTANDATADRVYLIPWADMGQHLGVRIDDLSAVRSSARP